VKDYNSALSTLNSLKENNPKFAQFVKVLSQTIHIIKFIFYLSYQDCEAAPECNGQVLNSFLILPVQNILFMLIHFSSPSLPPPSLYSLPPPSTPSPPSSTLLFPFSLDCGARIPRYSLLLTDLVKHTWEDHRDYVDLCGALKQVQVRRGTNDRGRKGRGRREVKGKMRLNIIQEVALYVNEKKREAENISRVLEIQNNFTGKYEVRSFFLPLLHLPSSFPLPSPPLPFPP
jgi:hypothetical protein